MSRFFVGVEFFIAGFVKNLLVVDVDQNRCFGVGILQTSFKGSKGCLFFEGQFIFCLFQGQTVASSFVL